MSQNVIVITIEGIATSLVGAYGSSIAETPTLDSLAAHGIVLDQCFLDSRRTDEMLASLWSGRHALTRQLHQLLSNAQATTTDTETNSVSNIWQALLASSGHGVFVTDCAQAASLAQKFGCERVEVVAQATASEPAEEVLSCALLGLFSAAAEAIAAIENADCAHRLCWIHSRGLRLPWDAPIELRNSFKDADDPDPPDIVGPPQLHITEDTDPDLVVGWSQVAAAQTAVLDQAIALLHSVLPERWSWCVLGIDGCPLGEHDWVGCGQSPLHDEQLQSVAIVCPWPAPLIGWRVAEICQLPDLGVTIAELCGLKISDAWGTSQLGEPQDAGPIQWESQHQVALIVDEDKVWIRTPAWACTLDSAQGGKLYVKPDDRWESSEISNRCQDVIDKLRLLADQFIAAAKINRRSDLHQLSELLYNFRR